VYTGNHGIASKWVASKPEGRRLTVIDTGAASGRLGLMAHHTARYAAAGNGFTTVLERVRAIGPICDELVFLDQLKYLVAGGRLSRTKGFFGDLLHLKPVIRPTAQGAQKAGVVKNRRAQIDFAVEYLKARRSSGTAFELLFCHTDNRDWVLSEVKPAIEAVVPVAESYLQPMSLTSGVHMGPGTWAVAFLPVSASGRSA
jgi:DegV family protein with EDD domain